MFIKTRPVLTLQLWERSPSLDSQLIPFSDQQWIQTAHHGVGTKLDFPCCYFKRWTMENVRYWGWEWTLVWGTVNMCDIFLIKILCVCRCSSWGAASGVCGGLVKFGGETLTLSCAACGYTRVTTECPWFARLHGNGLNGSRALIVLLIC
jgi:hypothetical protein